MKTGDIEFSLKDSFLNKYKRKTVQWGPLGYFSYKRTYARPTTGTKTEEWWQTIRRVVEGTFLVQKQYCSWWHLPWSERSAQRSAQTMYDLMFTFKFLPSGRGLFSMGTPFMFEKGSACLNSCGYVSTANLKDEFSAPFTWLMEMSLLGVGVGFDTEGAELDMFLKEPRTDSKPHVVEDSREGWTDVFRRVLDAYSGKDTLPLEVDYSQIRPEGSPIKGFGGIAPGPEPLQTLIDRTKGYCRHHLIDDKSIDSTFIVDIMNFVGAAVVAGGLPQRMSEIAFGSPEDEEFLDLKTESNLKSPELARWASNNSLMATVGMDYTEAAARSATNGEPGYFWLENARAYGRTGDGKNHKDHRASGSNPCGEQTLESFELCNLVETFPSKHDTLNEYLLTLKYAYMYAKTTTLLHTHDPRTNAVMFRNRRIGLSQSGIIEQINKIGFREHMNWCEAGYQKVQYWDLVYSDWLCVPRSIKTTCVKPSGTVSLLVGVTPGIHYPHSEYYKRRIRVSKSSDLIKIMKDAGYKVETDAAASHTMVIEFPVHEPHFVRRKDEVGLYEQFELAAAMQAKWTDNQVSITITIRPEEAKQLPMALSMYETRLKAVSFLPLRGDKVYEQPPYEQITEEEYKKAVDKIKTVRYNVETEDRVEERFCDADTCSIN